MKLAEATRQYQDALEADRQHDDEDTAAQLADAERVMNAEWLRHTVEAAG